MTVLGFDNIMPLFSVWHESAALGCEVDWGDRSRMPTGKPCCPTLDAELAIPRDFLLRPSCRVPLEALRELKRRHGDEVAGALRGVLDGLRVGGEQIELDHDAGGQAI